MRQELIRVGNFHDHAEWLADADWIIESVVENLDVKKQVHGRISQHRRRGTLVSSNTSGISIRTIAEDLSEDYQECFPRYTFLQSTALYVPDRAHSNGDNPSGSG